MCNLQVRRDGTCTWETNAFSVLSLFLCLSISTIATNEGEQLPIYHITTLNVFKVDLATWFFRSPHSSHLGLVGRLKSPFSTKTGYIRDRLRMANDTVTARPHCLFVQWLPNMGKDSCQTLQSFQGPRYHSAQGGLVGYQTWPTRYIWIYFNQVAWRLNNNFSSMKRESGNVADLWQWQW